MAVASAVILAFTVPVEAATEVTSGTLPDGTPYRIDYPDNWNGTVLVSLDYAPNGGTQGANVELLRRGYATSGVTRNVTGWSVGDSINNHVRVVELFTEKYGPPTYAFVNGNSLGAHTGAAVVQARPDVFDGGVLHCGGLAGAIGLWNSKLDALYVAKTLIAPGDPRYPIIDIPDDFATVTRPNWLAMLQQAQQTPEGKARIALAAVIAQLPTWSVGNKPIPAPGDYDALQVGLYDSLAGGGLPVVGQAMSSRNEINRRSGGNISWNLGVDYTGILEQVENADVVRAMYEKAGLSLADDLAKLKAADRIVADPDAIRWARVQVISDALTVPVITLNGIGDQISPVAGQQAYEQVAGSKNLRQTYLQIAGHCGFNTKETVAAVEVLQQRVRTGEWPNTSAAAMNTAAASVPGPGAPRFIEYTPDAFARPYTPVNVHAKLSADVIVTHSNGIVELVLTPPQARTPEFAADKLDPTSMRLAGVEPVGSYFTDNSLVLKFRARNFAHLKPSDDAAKGGKGVGKGTEVRLALSGAYIYGVPVDEAVIVRIK